MTDESIRFPPHHITSMSDIEYSIVYILRSVENGNNNLLRLDDLRKAAWYINREIERLTRPLDRDSDAIGTKGG